MALDDQDYRICVPYREENYRPIEPTLADLMAAIARLDEKIECLCTQPHAAPASEYLTVEEAARDFKVSTATLYRLKHLQCRIRGAIRFKRQALENHLRPRRQAS